MSSDKKAAVNEPYGMYNMKELSQLPEIIPLPTTMYKMKNVYESNIKNGDVQALEQRQERILRQLQELKLQLQRIRSEVATQNSIPQKSDLQTANIIEKKVEEQLQNLVITAHPSHPPLSLSTVVKILKENRTVGLRYHVHSSVQVIPENLNGLLGAEEGGSMSKYDLFITLIWKNNDDEIDPMMMIDPLNATAIKGEVNILRHLSSWTKLPGDKKDPDHSTDVDSVLDLVHGSLFHGTSKERQSVLRWLNARLGKMKWLTGSDLSIADLAAWSALRQFNLADSAPANVKKWVGAMKGLEEN